MLLALLLVLALNPEPIARNARELYIRVIEPVELFGCDLDAVGADGPLTAGSVAFPDAPPILTLKTILE